MLLSLLGFLPLHQDVTGPRCSLHAPLAGKRLGAPLCLDGLWHPSRTHTWISEAPPQPNIWGSPVGHQLLPETILVLQK